MSALRIMGAQGAYRFGISCNEAPRAFATWVPCIPRSTPLHDDAQACSNIGGFTTYAQSQLPMASTQEMILTQFYGLSSVRIV